MNGPGKLHYHCIGDDWHGDVVRSAYTADLLSLPQEEFRRVPALDHVALVRRGSADGYLFHGLGQLSHFPNPASSFLYVLQHRMVPINVLSTLSVQEKKYDNDHCPVFSVLGRL